MLALVSDIHANIEAFTAVMDHIRTNPAITKVYCLGDVVGYGPDPEPCLDIAMNLDLNLMGNHEYATLNQAYGFSAYARDAVDWHRKLLKPGLFSARTKKKRWNFLSNEMKSRHEEEEGRILFVHGGPQNPIEEYLLRTDLDEVMGELSKKLVDAFELTRWLCIVGHTHTPGIIFEEAKFIHPSQVNGTFTFEEGRKYLVNVSSVGQPRDGDPRACYVTFDGETKTMTWHRVEYDVEKTAAKIREKPHLNDFLGERLIKGV
ncbi:MAG: metallophosphoesterase [Planctomycetota bacterium]|nr:MAG: metallophosphoesterase [Planctomycetota bacterium]